MKVAPVGAVLVVAVSLLPSLHGAIRELPLRSDQQTRDQIPLEDKRLAS